MTQRNFTRVSFRTEALVKTSTAMVSGTVENLSLNGMFLRTPERLPVEADVDVSISLAGSSSELAIRLKGAVLRHEPEGMAILFKMKGIDVDSFVHLRNIIAYNHAGDKNVLQEYFAYIDQEKKNGQ